MTALAQRRMAGAGIVAALSSLLVLVPAWAGAQEVLIEVPLSTVVEGPEGSEHVLGQAQVPEELVGQVCDVRAVASNQVSVHPGNDLVITSGSDRLVLSNVEGEADQDQDLEGTLELGSDITVVLIMGPDEIFSGGIVVEVRCPETEPTTTQPPTTDTTEPSETTETTEPGTPTTDTSPDTTSEVGGETTSTSEQETTTTVSPTTEGDDTTSTTGDVGASTLPFTGSGTASTAGVGALALVLGGALLFLTRKDEDSLS